MYRHCILRFQQCSSNLLLSLSSLASPCQACQCRCSSASPLMLTNHKLLSRNNQFIRSIVSVSCSKSKHSSTNSFNKSLLGISIKCRSQLLPQSLYKSFSSKGRDFYDDEFDEFDRKQSSVKIRSRRQYEFPDYEDDYEGFNTDDNRPRSSSRRYQREEFTDPFSRSRRFQREEFMGPLSDYDESPRSRGRRYEREEFTDPSSSRFGSRMGSSRDMREFQLKQKNWSSGDLAAVEKNFFVEHESIAEMSQSEIDEFYSENHITISRGEKMRPVMDFHHANFPDPINNHMERMNWEKPTLIQSLGWPIALSGKNMVGIAQTGSGKTLGFTLPALVHIKHQRQVMKGEGPVVLIMAPTRELAQQITSVTREYGRLLGVRSCAVFGGASKEIQMRNLEESPDILVATPGRLLDFLESDVINLDRTTFTVLDEADRMLDMGFEPQIRKVLGQIRPDRQLLMWSATWPKESQRLAHDFLQDFTQVNIGAGELVANPNIEQIVKVCDSDDKMKMLVKELIDAGSQKTLIFTQTKSRADVVTRVLRRQRFRALAIHGDKSQSMRNRTLDSFRSGETQILVATDVASRGLDVDDIKLVVNYDYPNTDDGYIHRIGRTGRASKTGKALTFLTREESGRAKELISVLRDANQTVPEELEDLLHRNYRSKGKINFGRRNTRPQPGFPRFYDDNTDWR